MQPVVRDCIKREVKAYLPDINVEFEVKAYLPDINVEFKDSEFDKFEFTYELV